MSIEHKFLNSSIKLKVILIRFERAFIINQRLRMIDDQRSTIINDQRSMMIDIKEQRSSIDLRSILERSFKRVASDNVRSNERVLLLATLL